MRHEFGLSCDYQLWNFHHPLTSMLDTNNLTHSDSSFRTRLVSDLELRVSFSFHACNHLLVSRCQFIYHKYFNFHYFSREHRSMIATLFHFTTRFQALAHHRTLFCSFSRDHTLIRGQKLLIFSLSSARFSRYWSLIFTEYGIGNFFQENFSDPTRACESEFKLNAFITFYTFLPLEMLNYSFTLHTNARLAERRVVKS